MGLMDILNGMQNGPGGQTDPNAKGGMSPMTMAILALIAYKGYKHLTAGGQGGAPAPQQMPSGGGSSVGGGLLGDVLGGLMGGAARGGLGGAPGGGGAGGLGDLLKGPLGGMLAGGAAGAIRGSNQDRNNQQRYRDRQGRYYYCYDNRQDECYWDNGQRRYRSVIKCRSRRSATGVRLKRRPVRRRAASFA